MVQCNFDGQTVNSENSIVDTVWVEKALPLNGLCKH